MKYLLTQEDVDIPDKVDVSLRGREVTVKGPLGTLKRNFNHLTLDIRKH